MALNDLFCADVLLPLDVVPLTDITYKYHPGDTRVPDVHQFITKLGNVIQRMDYNNHSQRPQQGRTDVETSADAVRCAVLCEHRVTQWFYRLH